MALNSRKGDPDSRFRGWSWMILPAFLILMTTFFIPVGYLASFGFRPHVGPGQIGPDFTISNYARFLLDPFYLGILLNTLLISALVVSICMVLAYPVAYLLARSRSRWRGMLFFLVLAPLLIATVVRNLGWFPILGDSGLVNWMLLSTGLINSPIRLVNNVTGVVIALVHTFLPFMILALVTVIQKIGIEIEEASQNLGAGPWRTFFKVILPLSRPGLLAGYLIIFTSVISAFTTPAMMGGKRVLLMSTFIEQQIRSVLNYPFGAATAILLMAVGMLVTIVSLRTGDRR